VGFALRDFATTTQWCPVCRRSARTLAAGRLGHQVAISARRENRESRTYPALSNRGTFPSLLGHPIYAPGQAYLAASQDAEAVKEFRKILDHRGIMVGDPIGVLAHFQLGRAYANQGDTIKARAAYQDFITLWKDADPDIPVLKQAQAEYAKLQSRLLTK
jgi:tetratricopeptide (TPR) repeat protein